MSQLQERLRGASLPSFGRCSQKSWMRDLGWFQHSFSPKASRVSGSRILPALHFRYIHKYIHWISVISVFILQEGGDAQKGNVMAAYRKKKKLLSLALKVEFLLTSGIFLFPLGESGFVWVSCHLSTFILNPEENIKSDWKIRLWNSWYRSVRPVYRLPSRSLGTSPSIWQFPSPCLCMAELLAAVVGDLIPADMLWLTCGFLARAHIFNPLKGKLTLQKGRLEASTVSCKFISLWDMVLFLPFVNYVLSVMLSRLTFWTTTKVSPAATCFPALSPLYPSIRRVTYFFVSSCLCIWSSLRYY